MAGSPPIDVMPPSSSSLSHSPILSGVRAGAGVQKEWRGEGAQRNDDPRPRKATGSDEHEEEEEGTSHVGGRGSFIRSLIAKYFFIGDM